MVLIFLRLMVSPNFVDASETLEGGFRVSSEGCAVGEEHLQHEVPVHLGLRSEAGNDE
jgi:hypothetical protein